jgi:homoserine kinase
MAVMELAIAMEGHPDNVVPAQFGGCRLSATGVDRDWEICDLPWHEDVGAIVAIPNFELSTEAARQVLPSHYSRADAIFNTAHLGLLLQGLATAQADWLRAALQDRIHQPYREALIPGYGAVRSAAIEAGAYGLVISGAGPTLLALTPPDQAAAVAAAMADSWSATGMVVDVKELAIDRQGARIS